MKIIVTGAEGMLGTAFVEEAGSGCDILALSKDHCDVSDSRAVDSLAHYQADWIVHCAAPTNVEFCEANPDIASRIIVDGARNIVRLAKKLNCSVLFPQSFLIFGPSDTAYIDAATPSPKSVYGILKRQAEEIILTEHSQSMSLRLGGFFGGRAKDKNFVGKFIKHLAENPQIHEGGLKIGNRVWQPTYTNDIAKNALILMSLNKFGIYNMAAHGEARFYDVAKLIVETLGIETKIVLVNEKDIRADNEVPRPGRVLLDNQRLRQENLDSQRHWRNSLAEYLFAWNPLEKTVSAGSKASSYDLAKTEMR